MTVELGHIVPLAKENRWSDLLAVLVETDPGAASTALALERPLISPRVYREGRGSGKDRIDLLIRDAGGLRAVVEVKVLSGLGQRQLDRYRKAHPDADDYVLIFPEQLPLVGAAEAGWRTRTWDSLLTAFADSAHPWVSETANAWLDHLKGALPALDGTTKWNDLRDGEDFVLALRARMSWVFGSLNPPPPIVHDLVESSAGVSWVARMNTPARKEGYVIRVEAEEKLPVRDFPKYVSATSCAPRGPSIKVCLVQTGVSTSAGFDWNYLLEVWQVMAVARNDWVTVPARPRAPHDREGWQGIVNRGAPKFLGVGFGEAQARHAHECMFGARIQLAPDITLRGVVNELVRLLQLMLDLALV